METHINTWSAVLTCWIRHACIGPDAFYWNAGATRADIVVNEPLMNMIRSVGDLDQMNPASNAVAQFIANLVPDSDTLMAFSFNSDSPNNSQRHGGWRDGMTDKDEQPFIVTMDASCRLFEFSVSFVMVGITCLFGLIGNVLSVMTLHRDSVKSVTTFLLSALAIADFAFLVPAVFVIMIPTYCEFYQHCASGFVSVIPYLEQYGWALASTCHTCTVYVTVLVSLHRYLCVCKIHLAQKLSGFRRVKMQAGVIPFVALLYNSPRFFEYKIIHYAWNDTSTGEEIIRRETTKILATVGRNHIFQIGYKNALFFIVMYLIPLAILVMVSVNLIRKLKERRRTLACLSSSKSTSKRKRDDSITLVLIIIIATFIVCQTPTMIQRMILTASGSNYLGCGYFYFYFEQIADYMALLNSSTNFLIYIVFSPHFRRTLIADVLCQQSDSDKSTGSRKVRGAGRRGRDVRNSAVARNSNALPVDKLVMTNHAISPAHSDTSKGMLDNKWLNSKHLLDCNPESPSHSTSQLTSQELIPIVKDQSDGERRGSIINSLDTPSHKHSANVEDPESNGNVDAFTRNCSPISDANSTNEVLVPLIAIEPATSDAGSE